MAKIDQESVPGKLSRRQFLRLAEGTGVGFALSRLPRLRRGEFSLPPKRSHPGDGEGERKNKYEFTREEILKNPMRFIDSVLERILAMSPEQRQDLPDALRNFYSNFAVEDLLYSGWDTMSESDREAHRKDRTQFRRAFTAGYQLYGQRVTTLSERVDKVSQVSPDEGQYYYGSFNSLATWWNALDALRIAFEPTKPDYWRFTTNHLEELFNLRWWFDPLTRSSTYEDQRSDYIDQATDKSNKTYEATLDVWDIDLKGETLPARSGNEVVHTQHQKEVLKRLLRAFESTYLGAFTQTRSIDIVHLWFRAHYNPGFDTVTLDTSFFDIVQVVELLEAEAKGSGEFNPDAIALLARMVDQFLVTLKHELGHGFDLNQYSVDGSSLPARIPYGVHPANHLEFAETRLKYLEIFEQAVRGDDKHQPLSFKELVHWPLNPLTPKNFGLDEITSSKHVDAFTDEINTLVGIWTRFGALSSDTREFWLSITGMKELVHGFGQTLPIWKIHQKHQVLNQRSNRYEYVPVESALKDPGFALDRLNIDVLEGMQQLAKDTWDSDTSIDPVGVLNALVDAKEHFVFLTYVFLDRLCAKGLISLGSEKTQQFAYDLQSLQVFFVHQHNLHAVVGPFGEYVSRNADFTLQQNAVDQIELAKRKTKSDNIATDHAFGTHVSEQTGLNKTADAMSDQLIQTQVSMQKAMGMPLLGKETGWELLDRDRELFNNVMLSLSENTDVQEALNRSLAGKG